MSVTVRTLFFAAYRDLAGTAELPVELDEGAQVRDLVRSLRERGGGFAELPSEPAVAVNRTYAPLTRTLQDEDEVAFIPPVAGG